MKQSNIMLKILKLTLIIFLVTIFINTGVYAAINNEYSSAGGVTGENLNEAVAGSTVLEAIAKLVFAAGRMLEWLLGVVFKMLTGTEDFPWADKIVFNAVPLLDVNFINPDKSSFVIAIKDVLQNVYSTIFGIAFAFFGITVMITAIRLVLSTIASEKAKYKKAITDWLLGLIMLFCIHYFISFVFYLNEQLVKVASNIVTTRLEQANTIAQAQIAENAKKIIRNMGDEVLNCEGSKYNGVKIKDILEENITVLYKYLSFDSTRGLQKMLSEKYRGEQSGMNYQRQDLGMLIAWAVDPASPGIDSLNKVKDAINSFEYIQGINITCGQAIHNVTADFLYGKYKGLTGASVYANDTTDLGDVIEQLLRLGFVEPEDAIFNYAFGEYGCYGYEKCPDGLGTWYVSGGFNEIEENPWWYELAYDIGGWAFGEPSDWYWTIVVDELKELRSTGIKQTERNEFLGKMTLLPDLAYHFKNNVYEMHVESEGNIVGLTKGNAQIQNMLMYAILVVQSLILFIAYVKRLFYVLMLAMMAPIVVVMEFFQGFGK